MSQWARQEMVGTLDGGDFISHGETHMSSQSVWESVLEIEPGYKLDGG